MRDIKALREGNVVAIDGRLKQGRGRRDPRSYDFLFRSSFL